MRLVRCSNLDAHVKNMCARPTKKEGIFLAKHDCHDLPEVNGNADLPHLLKNGRVWVGRAGTKPEWREIFNIKDLPKFKPYFFGLESNFSVAPYMPQFFFCPKNSRGNRTMRKIK